MIHVLLLFLTAVRTPVPVLATKPHVCPIEGVAEEVQCATYPVWEDRDRRAGRKIGLKIVILRASGRDRAPDPLFVLAGGPGQAATETVAGFARSSIRERRDIVFVDQRGTGGSNPLDCDLYGHPTDLQLAATTAYPLDAIRACKQRLEKLADLKLYTTPLAMDDVDDVRGFLGYQKINLWGGSYGSYAAQVYLARHAANVRSVVLAGVLPLDELIPLHHAWAGQRAVDILLAKCRANATCNAAYPDLTREFRSLFDRVRQGVDVEVHDETGRKARVRPSVGAFAEGIRHSLYHDDGRSFPRAVHQGAQGDLAPLVQAGVDAAINFRFVLSMGMLLSVTCSEDLPFIDDATLAHETKDTFLGDLRVKEQRAACQEWVRGPVPPDLHQLVHSPVPVLLLSGERDAVTPPAFGDRVAKALPASRHVIFPEASHGNWGGCGNRIAADFVERGSAAGLDASCAAAQPATPFVTGQR